MSKILKKQSFLISALVLAVGGIIAKIIGAFYKIPLTHILGSNGMGVYYLIFPIYSLFLVLSSSGVSLAVTKLVASERKQRNRSNEHKIFQVGLVISVVLGILFALTILMFSKEFAIYQGNINAYLGYLSIAPAIIFASIISIIRGYFQGTENMIPTSISNILEQLTKLLFGLLLSYKFLNLGIEYGVVGAILGVTISELIAMLMLIINYLFFRKKEKFYLKTEKARNKVGVYLFYNAKLFQNIKLKVKKLEKQRFFEYKKSKNLTTKETFNKVLKYGLFATLSSVVIPLTSFIDSFLVINLLVRSGFSSNVSTSLYGLSNGVVSSLISLPVLLISALSTAIVPNLSNTDNNGEKKLMESKCGFYIKITWLITLPLFVFFVIYSSEIISILFGKGLTNRAFDEIVLANKLLLIGSVQILYYGFLQTFTAILQAINKPAVPTFALGISLLLRIGLTIILVKNPSINVFGVLISNIIFLSVATFICLFSLKKYVNLNLCIKSFLWYPLFSIFVGGGVSFILKNLLGSYISILLSTLISGVIGVLIYLMLLLSLAVFNEREIDMIPLPKKIFRRVGN